MYRMMIFAGAAFLATAASANQRIVIVSDGVPTAHVSYADLDLRSHSDRSRMARRIRIAAEDICVGSAIETSVIGPLRNDCYVAAVASGIRQMNAIAGI